jgi:ankyrin repeat protein
MTLALKSELSSWKRLVNAIENGNVDKVSHVLDTIDPSLLLSHTHSHVELEHPASRMFGTELRNVNALQLAIIRGYTPVAVLILETICKKNATLKSRFLNHTCADGNTALHFASFQNMTLLVVSMLRFGANPYAKNDKKLRPLDCTYDEEVFQALMMSQDFSKSAPSTSFNSVLLQKAASQKTTSQDLPHTPPDTNNIPQDYFDTPPKSTRPSSKESSISIPTPPPSPTTTNQSDPNALSVGKSKTRFCTQAVLIDGCINGDTDSVQDALKNGAKINLPHGAYDKSPLMIALINMQEEVARVLLSSDDLNINYSDSNGQ